jgi:Spy/CpxP family protein refolding chaperone
MRCWPPVAPSRPGGIITGRASRRDRLQPVGKAKSASVVLPCRQDGNEPEKRTDYGSMRRVIASALLCAITGLSVAGAVSADGTRKPWWADPSIQCQLNLTTRQVSRLSAIFKRDLPARRVLNERIRQLDARLHHAIQDDNREISSGLAAQVEDLRRQQNTRRSLMLIEMYRTLTPAQRARLDMVHATGVPGS